MRTFSIGFESKAYDESPHAQAVADHLGTDHTNLTLTEGMLQQVVPQLPQIYDEPFADSSQIPTTLVCRLARGHVTVALSGDGGDETFAGYNRHLWLPKVLRAAAPLPEFVRQGLAGVLMRTRPDLCGDGVRCAGTPAARGSSCAPARPKNCASLGACCAPRPPGGAYDALTSIWPDPQQVVLGAVEDGASHVWLTRQRLGDRPLFEALALYDMIGYLPDDILTKVDRASMSVSLEARVPLLDHRLVEMAIRTPGSLKIRPRSIEVGDAPTVVQACAPRAHRAAEDGLWRAAWPLAPRGASAMGRGADRAKLNARPRNL